MGVGAGGRRAAALAAAAWLLAASAGLSRAGRGHGSSSSATAASHHQAAAPPSGALRDGDSGYQIVVARGWVPVDPPAGTLLAYQAPGGHARLAVTRASVGSRSPRTFPRVVDDVERGVRRATHGYRRIRRRTGQIGRVRTLDLWYRRADHATVLSRYLFYHSYTVVLSIGLERGAAREARHAARATLRSFTIFPP